MSNWSHLAQDVVEEVFDSSAKVNLLRLANAHAMVRVSCLVGAWSHTLAIAGGEHSDDAWRMLIRIVARPQGCSLSTQEVAQVVGVDESRIRRQVLAGRLVADEGASGVRAARFAPAEVWRFVAESGRVRAAG